MIELAKAVVAACQKPSHFKFLYPLEMSIKDKIETIAHACGYENPFVFSTTFKKWVGWRPSEYRARKR